MIKLFCGHDRREQPGLHTFIHSVLEHASEPVAFTPLSSMGMLQGSNEFTLARFMVAKLCGFKGHAIFCDASDMLVMADIAELDDLFDSRYAVQVVKHPTYLSRHERKYVGTPMECIQSNYPKKNHASVMIVNAEHPAWRNFYATHLPTITALKALQFSWLGEDLIGSLPPEWNVLVDEGQESSSAKLLHWTAGVPGFPAYSDAPRAQDWFHAHRQMSVIQ